MLLLYTKDNCQYCEKVKRTFLERGIVYEERNIGNPEHLKEVQMRGARTMPFLVDTSANLAMGESDDIIDYASEHSF
jgi:glutaredoxin